MVKRNLSSLMFATALAVFFAAGCGAGGRSQVPDSKAKVKGDRKLISHSEGVEPLWIQQCPSPSDHLLPYCGEAIRQPSQKMACTGAHADALGKLRTSIGQKVDAKLVPDGQGGYRFEIQGAKSDPLTIRGAWEDQRWFEEYEGSEGRTYDCYVMLTYPRFEYDTLIGMARKAALDKVVKAGELHREGKDLIGQGRHAEAAQRFQRAQALLAGLREPVISEDGSANSTLLAEQVAADLKTAQAEAGQAARTALVVLRLVLEGKNQPGGRVAKSVRGRIKKWLAGRGIRIRPGGLSAGQVEAVLSGDRDAAARAAAEKGAGLLLVVDIEARFDQKDEMNVYYARAQGAFRLIRTADGRELAASDLGPEKGCLPSEHRSKRDTVVKALDNLCENQLRGIVEDALSKI